MYNRYPIFSTAFLVANTLALSTFGQHSTDRMLLPKPTTSIEVRLTDFARPPHPIELANMSLMPGGGGLRYQTIMPIAGRMAATTDAAKLRGALAPPAGVYTYMGAVDASAQATPVSGVVFGSPDSRVKLAPDTPVDWAVWGTNNEDGPLRLPYGGGYDQLSAQLPTSVLTWQTTQVRFGVDGSGFNYANYSLYPLYQSVTRIIDPGTGRIVSRREEIALQESANRAKLPRYIPVEGDTPQERGRVITLSSTSSGQPRFEGVAARYVASDKNALYRNMNLLTFDEAGNLLKELPIELPYNRKLTARLPVHDAAGKVVGTFSVFADGGGKKDARDPEDNRFSVVITDEQGEIWSQATGPVIPWVNGEGSVRAAIPHYVLRKGDKLLVFNSNQQKLLKPAEETWLFDKSGTATLVNSIPNSDIAKQSTVVIDSPTNVLSREQLAGASKPGWANFSDSRYLDSFTDTSEEIWVLLQRQADAPAGSTLAQAPAGGATGSKLLGFANKLNQLTGQSPVVTAPTEVSVELGKIYSDVFVLHFDADLKFKDQTVIMLDRMPEPIRFKRSVRPTGADYVLNNSTTTRLRIREGELSVERLTPVESVRLARPDTDNFLIDEASGKIYILYGIPQKPGLGQLTTYPLD